MKIFMIGETGLLVLEGARELIKREHEVSSTAFYQYQLNQVKAISN